MWKYTFRGLDHSGSQPFSYIIEVDKILLKDDCEDEFYLRDCNHRDVFSNGGMALHYTNVLVLADRTSRPIH